MGRQLRAAAETRRTARAVVSRRRFSLSRVFYEIFLFLSKRRRRRARSPRRYGFTVHVQYVYRRTVATRKALMTRAQALSSGGAVPLALSARTIDLRFTSRVPPRRRVSSVPFRSVRFFSPFVAGTLSPDTPYIRAAVVCDARASRPPPTRRVTPADSPARSPPRPATPTAARRGAHRRPGPAAGGVHTTRRRRINYT